MTRATVRSVDVMNHVKWARAIARGVREDFGFHKGSQEEMELEQTAYLALVRTHKMFDVNAVPDDGDVDGAFRGYVSHFIRGECKREARRLRNGGTYHTRRETDRRPISVDHLSDHRTPDGDLVELEERASRETYEPAPIPEGVPVLRCRTCGEDRPHRIGRGAVVAIECGDCEDRRRLTERQCARRRSARPS